MVSALKPPIQIPAQPSFIHLLKSLELNSTQVSTLLVTPIAPHWAEEVWSVKLQKPGCAITAGWPAAAEPDFALQVGSTLEPGFTAPLQLK